MSLIDYGALFGIVSVAVAVVISLAYHNVTFSVRSKLNWERDQSITLAMVRKDAAATKDNAKDLVAQLKANQRLVTQRESMSFSIIYNNLFFLLIVVFLGFYILRSLPGIYNYIVSVGVAAASVTYLSTTKTYD